MSPICILLLKLSQASLESYHCHPISISYHCCLPEGYIASKTELDASRLDVRRHPKLTLSFLFISLVQLISCVRLFATPWTAADQPSLSINNPGDYLNSCPLSQRCHPTISSSVIPFSSCLQSLPASGSFQVRLFFVSETKALEFQLQHQSFQWTLRTDFL